MTVHVARLDPGPRPLHGLGEEWLPVVGYEGLYEVSNKGLVWSLARQVILTAKPEPGHPMGYLRVRLSKGGKKRWYRLHSVVLSAFEGPRPKGMGARHLNGDVTDCSRRNLTWGTQLENIHDAIAHRTFANLAKNHCKRKHKFTPENTYINPRGFRQCRQCIREARGVKNPRAVKVAA